jgi:hypothetical protein
MHAYDSSSCKCPSCRGLCRRGMANLSRQEPRSMGACSPGALNVLNLWATHRSGCTRRQGAPREADAFQPFFPREYGQRKSKVYYTGELSETRALSAASHLPYPGCESKIGDEVTTSYQRPTPHASPKPQVRDSGQDEGRRGPPGAVCCSYVLRCRWERGDHRAAAVRTVGLLTTHQYLNACHRSSIGGCVQVSDCQPVG